MAKKNLNNFNNNIALWVILGVFLILFFNLMQGQNTSSRPERMSYSEFYKSFSGGQVREVKTQDDQIEGLLSNGQRFVTTIPKDTKLADKLANSGVKVTAAPDSAHSSSFLHIFLSWLPILIFLGFWVYFLRQMQSGSNRAMGFGKSRAKMLSDKVGDKVTFSDVAGAEEAKHEVEEIVDFLRSPQRFQKLGGKIPKGILLVGSPGTGKTLLARAIAGEADVPFFSISGSDFVEMFVGVGASRVRDMFEQAKKSSPCIVFIDEIDAVGRHRGAGLGGGNDEREQTLNQLLVEMDGFESNEGIILIAATNRPDVLDPALLRPGRFDRQVIVPLPDLNGREEILNVHTQKVPITKGTDLNVIARGTPGFSGADLANLVNEAALLSARRNRRTVSLHELEEAKDKVMMGSERKSMVMSDDEKRLTAYHEAGHALVAYHNPKSDPIHKATIIPRGHALGMVVRLPESDRFSMTLERIEADLQVAMGGRIAEIQTFGERKVTTGAASDIKQATDIARKMVMEWGLSKKLGPLTYGDSSQDAFMGHQVAQQKSISEVTANQIDAEIKSIVESAYKGAKKILTDYKSQLKLLAETLLKYETLTGDEITTLLKEGKIDRPDFKPTPKKRKTSFPKDEDILDGKNVSPEPDPQNA